jgi:hypothetical protein
VANTAAGQYLPQADNVSKSKQRLGKKGTNVKRKKRQKDVHVSKLSLCITYSRRRSQARRSPTRVLTETPSARHTAHWNHARVGKALQIWEQRQRGALWL